MRDRRAAALRYDGVGAPTVVAAGRGQLAEKILEAAQAAGVPVREDADLARALAALEIGTEIPEQLYAAVAEAIVWAASLSGRPLPEVDT
jgi:flagellar biosynthesis protein